MKKTLFTIPIFFLILLFSVTSCREGSGQQEENAAELQEANRLDSLSNDLEATREEIEAQTQELKEALDSL